MATNLPLEEGDEFGPGKRGRIAVALHNRPSPQAAQMCVESVRGGPSPDAPRPLDCAATHDFRGRHRLPFNGLLDVRGGDLTERFLCERHRAAARLRDVDRRQIRVRVASELRRAWDEITLDVPLEILHGDLGERRLCRSDAGPLVLPRALKLQLVRKSPGRSLQS